jgi:hypothetical protein
MCRLVKALHVLIMIDPLRSMGSCTEMSAGLLLMLKLPTVSSAAKVSDVTAAAVIWKLSAETS